ncbi:AAA family ATPase [Desulfosediminicola flagellatus]|uniref:cytidylate kinase-like family protein n=1 Tax=Desulfosediminicola flagellatus TaxID=2569541 RepID=UPI0010AD8FEE|nr:cytidylate kinase-like family protein [Desulfosediminicola flagellatus]
MSIVTISRGSYSRGKEVAEKLAEKLNYECVSRDIILEACAEFNIPEIKLIRALHDPTTVLERFKYGKEKYLAYFRYSLIKHTAVDNIVYHGLAGHYILRDVPHVLKVRILSNMEDRVKEEVRRENISPTEARYLLKKDDEERRKWGIQVYGTDTWDSRLYDIVLHINTLTIDDAVQILYDLVKKPQFQTTPESLQIIRDMEKSAKIKAMLINLSHKITVAVTNDAAIIGNVSKDLRDTVEKRVMAIDGINTVTLHESPIEKSHYINPYHNI